MIAINKKVILKPLEQNITQTKGLLVVGDNDLQQNNLAEVVAVAQNPIYAVGQTVKYDVYAAVAFHHDGRHLLCVHQTDIYCVVNY